MEPPCQRSSTADLPITPTQQGRAVATPEELPSPKRKEWVSSLTSAYAQPFRHRLIGGLYPCGVPQGTPWDFHRSVPFTILTRRQQQTPLNATESTRIPPGERDNVSQCFRRNGSLTPNRGRNLPPPNLCLPGSFAATGYPNDPSYIPRHPASSSKHFCTNTDLHR